MGFKEIRALLIEALLDSRYRHDDRIDAEEKNLLYTGAVKADLVVRLLRRCAGWEYSTSRHHSRDEACHIFTPTLAGERWYIKAYLEPGRAVFISVHP